MAQGLRIWPCSLNLHEYCEQQAERHNYGSTVDAVADPHRTKLSSNMDACRSGATSPGLRAMTVRVT